MKLKLVIGIMVMFLVAMMVPGLVAADDVEVPEFKKGDKWTYDMTNHEDVSDVNNLTQTMTAEIEIMSETQIEVGGTTHEVFVMRVKMTMYTKGDKEGVESESTMNMESWMFMKKSNLGIVRSDEWNNMTEKTKPIAQGLTHGWSNWSMKSHEVKTYNPAKDDFNFPFSEGDSWSYTTTTTYTRDSKTDYEGTITNDTDSGTETETENFTVGSKESVTVPKGTFDDAYKVTSEDGQNHQYFSPKAGMFVKMVNYDEEGNLTMTMELKSYTYSAGGSGETTPGFEAIFVLASMVVLVGVARYNKKRN